MLVRQKDDPGQIALHAPLRDGFHQFEREPKSHSGLIICPPLTWAWYLQCLIQRLQSSPSPGSCLGKWP
jgi:hypothetical protein